MLKPIYIMIPIADGQKNVLRIVLRRLNKKPKLKVLGLVKFVAGKFAFLKKKMLVSWSLSA